jgi:hypothetical protein
MHIKVFVCRCALEKVLEKVFVCRALEHGKVFLIIIVKQDETFSKKMTKNKLYCLVLKSKLNLNVSHLTTYFITL